jgi:hypothetical protein
MNYLINLKNYLQFFLQVQILPSNSEIPYLIRLRGLINQLNINQIKLYFLNFK